MAKTKKQCLAMQRTDLHAEPPQHPPAPPPSVRHTRKRAEEKVNATESKKAKSSEMEVTEVTDPPFELCWENLAKVKKFYQITYQEACELLSEVVGPDPKGAAMRDALAKVKKERPETSASTKSEPPPKNANSMPGPKNAKSMPELDPQNAKSKSMRPTMENEKPDGGPLVPEEGEDSCEGEEEEDFEGDPIDEADEIAVSATSKGNDDDQDSPAAGATVEHEGEVMGRPEAVAVDEEPTRSPVVVNPEVEAAKGAVPSSWKTTVPTPARKSSRKIVQATRVDSSDTDASNPNLRSLLSCSTLQLGQQHLSRQASCLDLGHAARGSKEASDLASELGPSASEVADRSFDKKMETMVSSLRNLKQSCGQGGDEEMCNMLNMIAPNLLRAIADDDEEQGHDEQQEVVRAKRGLPTSYKPRKSARVGPHVPEDKPVPSNEPSETTDKTDKTPETKTPATIDKSPMDKKPELDKTSDAMINSSSHRASHARLTRKMQGLDPAKFPHMCKLWQGGRKEKQDLLRQWVSCKENIENVETTLRITRSQTGELEHNRELLTIAEMRSRGFSQKKIETIITKSTPHPDPDCPDDEESVRFWCSLGGKMSQRETTQVTATAESTIETTPDALGHLLGGSADLGPGSAFSGGPVGNRPALKSLLDLANAPDAETAPVAKAKAKTKAKAKARVQQQTPKTPAEQRQAIRNQLKGEFTKCSVGLELPSGHALRSSLDEAKEFVEALMDELKDVSDDDLSSFEATCTEEVRKIRMLRAQARAVATELRKEAES